MFLHRIVDPNDGGVGGCGKCLLVQNDNSLHPEWTAVVMKKNRCPPHSNGCGAGEPHFDIAAPGFDNLAYSQSNVCGQRPGTGFNSKEQSAVFGSWYQQCPNTAECIHLCDQLPTRFIRGCKLFASWGWKRGDPTNVKYKVVTCPERFVEHIRAQFGPGGATGGDGPTPPTQAPTPAPTPVTAAGCTVTPDAAISGHNNQRLSGATIASCAAACHAESWCKSFDFHKNEGKCDLSDKSASDVGGLKTSYKGNPYDHYDCTADREFPQAPTPAPTPKPTPEASTTAISVRKDATNSSA